jgi:cbb3-type cytochrome oxidase subunit 3
MIPENFKDILNNEQNTGLYQTLALVIFLILFIGIIVSVFSKSKKYYNDAADIPLQDEDL